MDQEQLLKVIEWAKVHETNLNALYKQFKADTGDNKTTFPEFCFGMYEECKHS